MTNFRDTTLGLVCAVWSLAPSAATATTQPAPPERPSLELTVTVVRNEGTSDAAERSHTLALTPGEAPSTDLREGREVPIGDTYRNVGTNLKCRVRARGNGYLLWCAFEESSLVKGAGPLMFDTLNVVNQVVVSLGERVRLAGASPSATGPGWSVSVELNPPLGR